QDDTCSSLAQCLESCGRSNLFCHGEADLLEGLCQFFLESDVLQILNQLQQEESGHIQRQSESKGGHSNQDGGINRPYSNEGCHDQQGESNKAPKDPASHFK